MAGKPNSEESGSKYLAFTEPMELIKLAFLGDYNHVGVQNRALSAAEQFKKGGMDYYRSADAMITPFLTIPWENVGKEAAKKLGQYNRFTNDQDTRAERIRIAREVLRQCVQQDGSKLVALKALSDACFDNFQSTDGMKLLLESWYLQVELYQSQNNCTVTESDLFRTLEEIFSRVRDNYFFVETRKSLFMFFWTLLTPGVLQESLFLKPTDASQRMNFKIQFFEIFMRVLLGDSTPKNLKDMMYLRELVVSLPNHENDDLLMDNILAKPEIYRPKEVLEEMYQALQTEATMTFHERTSELWLPAVDSTKTRSPRWLSEEKAWISYRHTSRMEVMRRVGNFRNIVKLNTTTVTRFVQEELELLCHEAGKVLLPNDPLRLAVSRAYYDAAHHNRQGGPIRDDGKLLTSHLDFTKKILGDKHPFVANGFIEYLHMTFRTASHDGNIGKWELSSEELQEAHDAVTFVGGKYGKDHELTAKALQILGCAQRQEERLIPEAHKNLVAAVETLDRVVGRHFGMPEEVCNILKRVVHGYAYGMFNELPQLQKGLEYAQLYFHTMAAKRVSRNKIRAAGRLVDEMKRKIREANRNRLV